MLHLCCICRFNKREWWSSAGALSSRNLPVSHHLPGVPHSRSTCQSGRGLWLRKTPQTSHLTKLSFHGPTSSVRDGCFVRLDRENSGTFWTLISWTGPTNFQNTDLLATALTSKTVTDLQRCFQEVLVWCYLWVYKQRDMRHLIRGPNEASHPLNYTITQLVWVTF